MRILLAHNSLYYPSHGGGDKSNRLLMEALAERGHRVRAVTRVERFGDSAHEQLIGELQQRGVTAEKSHGPALHFHLNGVDVRVLTRNAHWRTFFSSHITAFEPDVILTSTDDPGQLLLDLALRSRARVVYLVRATVAAPFGPESSSPNAAKTAVLQQVDGVIGVSEYVARYTREWAHVDAVHVPISLLPAGEPPDIGRYSNRFVTMVNPCGVKGIGIFLALAERFPALEFAAVPSWGTTPADLEALARHPNVTVLQPVDDFDDILRQTRVALVPSLWAEARSRVILEAMSRRIPVLASAVGGLEEARLGVGELLPVRPVTAYRPALDQLMVPVAEIPEQDIEPWAAALQRLTADRDHWERLAAASRIAALAYAATLTAAPLECYLENLLRAPKRPRTLAANPLSPEKRRLLALRVKNMKTFHHE